jgi:hypothetical protein
MNTSMNILIYVTRLFNKLKAVTKNPRNWTKFLATSTQITKCFRFPVYYIVILNSIPGRGKDFFFPYNVQTGSGAHPASCSMGNGGSSSRTKRPGRESEHSPTFKAEINNEWSHTSTPPIRPHSEHRYKFTFLGLLRFLSTNSNITKRRSRKIFVKLRKNGYDVTARLNVFAVIHLLK